MRKHVFGRQLSRDTNERKALFKGLINALVMEESITTTEAKARSIRGQVEKLITKAKVKKSAAKSLLQPWLQPNALEKVMQDLSVRFASRPGGYTRIIKLGERFGDNASMAVIEFVEKKEKIVPVAAPKKTAEKTEVEATVKTAKAEKETKQTKKPTKDTKRKEAQEKRNTKKGSK